jgi:tRNA pseudouridine38-40 synthase
MIEANRFLQHMIRYLVGTMVEVATGNLSVDDFKAILNEKNPQAKVSKAPSKGLYLEKITY